MITSLPTRKKAGRLFPMICLEHDCGHHYETRRTSRPCPRCGSMATIPASRWNPSPHKPAA